MEKKESEQGSIMVEAAIYIPLVFSVVMVLLYLALFNMQEYLMMYEVQRVAAVVSREEAYLGYETFGMGSDNEIDWGNSLALSEDKVIEYYTEHFASLSRLYREIGRGGSGADIASYEGRFADALRASALISLGTLGSPKVVVDTGFLGTEVTVTITHELPRPGILAYLEYDGSTTVRSAAYTYSVNPSEFVRNVDLASDLIAYIFEKFGLGDKYNGVLNKVNEVLDKVL